MPSRRRAKVWRSGSGLVVVLPKDWLVGMGIEEGDLVDVVYNGSVEIRKIEEERDG